MDHEDKSSLDLLPNETSFRNETDFTHVKTSTKTIIAITNTTFDLYLLFNYLPITPYTVIKKKTGRKKKTDSPDPNKNIPIGSIISVQNKTQVRGVLTKERKKESKTYFLNSITIIIILDEGKMINTKVSHNGKFQITGCKTDAHYIDCLTYLYKHMNNVERYTGQKIYHLNANDKYPKAIFNIVMRNFDFKIGFNIQRDKLNTFIIKNTSFSSFYESSINTGVKIKIKSDTPYDPVLNCLEMAEDNNVSKVPYSEYLSYLSEKEKKKKESIVDKYFTFLIFSSGSCILSGSGPKIQEIYKEFLQILHNNREQFEERLIL